MQNEILDWQHPQPLQPCGVVVGCDISQEWILPWWWKHYSTHNQFPVLFVDFGLSTEAAQWCEQRGKVAALPSFPSLTSREEINPELVERWESAYGTEFWKSRASWFKKPFALLQTPFAKSLWLDVDCEVKQDISALFLQLHDDISLLPEPEYAHTEMSTFGLRAENETIYNSGVILYQHGSSIIWEWASETCSRADSFWSDQHILSRLIFEKRKKITELSSCYNWHASFGHNKQACIIHWLGNVGKEYIYLNLHGFL